jgi:hypothetical protein
MLKDKIEKKTITKLKNDPSQPPIKTNWNKLRVSILNQPGWELIKKIKID